MHTFLLHLHSGLRYLVLFFLLWAIIRSYTGWARRNGFTNGDRKIALLALIFTHLQLVAGLILYFISPIVSAALSDMGAAMKNPELRFWSIEHSLLMLVGIVLITIGYSTAKRNLNTVTGHKRIALLFTLGLILILAGVPWPFSGHPRPWF